MARSNKIVRVNPSTAQTDTELIAAPGAGRKIRVWAVYCSANTAMTVTIEEGSTTKWRQYVAANGGSLCSFGDEEPLFDDVTPATALTYTTSATGSVYLHVKYEIV